MPLASEILSKAAIVLQDNTHVRWPLSELAGWLNDALRAIVLAKPSENASTVEFDLGQGTWQPLVAADHLLFLGLVRNLKQSTPSRIGGRAIRATTRAVMDASEPNWHDPEEVPYAKEVRQFMFDEENPREFYVYPGNDGTGRVEALVAIMPDLVAATGAVDAIASYDVAIALREPLGPVILDFVLYRAFSKDAEGADPGRAQMHYNAFATALGIKVQVQRASDPSARAKVVSQ